MQIRPIRTDDDHAAALKEVDRLWGAAEGTADGDKLEVLVTLIEDYEKRRWPGPPGTPVDILHYAVSDMGRSQKELATILGSRSQASDILSGRRRISLSVAQKISLAWNIPIQLLVAPYALEFA